MKKTLALILTLALSLAALTGCGSKTETPADTNTDNSAQTEAPATLSGSVSTNGSTSMEKVIGALSEQFMADNSGVAVTYDPTGSGAGITAVLQSSAASIGILQTLVAQGLIGLDSAIFILFGQNIGTCVTALLACAGTNSTAKRAATVHLLFNVIGTVIFVIIACCLPLASWVGMLSPSSKIAQPST